MAFTASDSYTTQARVESLVQRGSFTSGTTPTAQQVLDFMALRSAEITSALANAGLAITPPTITNTTIARLCDMANAMLAAGDAILAHDVKDEQLAAISKELWAEGRSQLEAAVALAPTLVSSRAIFSDTNTDGLQFTSATEF
jgi:hypothetical protein